MEPLGVASVLQHGVGRTSAAGCHGLTQHTHTHTHTHTHARARTQSHTPPPPSLTHLLERGAVPHGFVVVCQPTPHRRHGRGGLHCHHMGVLSRLRVPADHGQPQQEGAVHLRPCGYEIVCPPEMSAVENDACKMCPGDPATQPLFVLFRPINACWC